MEQEYPEKPVLLQQFEVKGYKNLTDTIKFGPLGHINVIHGENNVGKSNVLQAMDLYFRFLDVLFSSAPIPVNASELESWGYPINEIFNLWEPTPIDMTGTFWFTDQQRGKLGIGRERLFEKVGIRVWNPQENSSSVKVDIKHIADGTPKNSVRGIIQFLSTYHPLQAKERHSRFALLGVNRRPVFESPTMTSPHIVSQTLHDELFDAKESRDATMVRRWELFVEAMKQFEPILGPGRFDTSFDRQNNRADLMFDAEKVRISIDLLGSGIQQLVALLGQLLLTPATLVGIEEPELNLRYTLQKQLLKAFQEITASEYGPEQLFLTSHSPAFEAEEHFFAMEIEKGTPTLDRRPQSLARVYTGMKEGEDEYAKMYAQQPEPVSYVSSEGLVMLPGDVRQALGVENGGGVSFIPNKSSGRFEIWTVNEVEQWLTRESNDDNDS